MMFRPTALTLLLALPLAAAAPRDLPAWQQGNEALAAGLWEVADARFQEALQTPGLSEAELRQLKLRRIEAWLRGDRGAEALAELNQSTFANDPEAAFWRAQALAGLGRYRDAVAALAPAVADAKAPYRKEALLTRSSLQLSLNDPEGALATLEPLAESPDAATANLAKLRQAAVLIDLGRLAEARKRLPGEAGLALTDRPERAFLDARLLLGEGKADAAASAFAVLLDQPEGQSLARYHAAALGLADALDATGNRSGAADSLLAFVQKFPNSPALEAIFKRLQQWLPERPAPNDAILERLAQWCPPPVVPTAGMLALEGDGAAGAWSVEATKETHDLAAFALYTRAIGLHRLGTPEAKAEAQRILTRVRLDHPNHFLAPRALLQLGRWLLEDGRTDRAFAALEAVRQSSAAPFLKGEAAFLEARASYDRGRMPEAAKWFDEAAEYLDAAAGEAAELNAALARLQSGQVPGVRTSGDAGRDAHLRTELELERALTTSSRQALERFLSENPSHPRAAETRLAVADEALREQPADLAAARTQLDALASGQPDGTTITPEEIDWLRLRIADLAGDVNGAISLSRDFLNHHPQAANAREASLVLGRNLFRNGDYNNARLTLEKLALSDPGSPLSQAALLLAARSAALGATAQSREEALALFQRVAAGNSPLAPLARLEHARLLIDRHRLDDAIAALQPWFDSLPAEDPLRPPAGLLLGEALYAKGNGSLAAALSVYDRLLAASKNQPALSARLHYLRGLTLEQLPRTDGAEGKRDGEALDSYYSVLQSANQQPPAEWEWFERCGFRALKLLETAGRWEAAVAVATKIASFNGPRAAEAAARARQLRLEHMIWEE